MTIPERNPPTLWLQSPKDETTPAQRPAGRRRQILDDETLDRLDFDKPEHEPEREKASVTNFIDRLARVIRNIRGKR
jgi:hypothetical protein